MVSNSNPGNMKQNNPEGKILLGLMPFWDPLIPPMGISCLKGFLNQFGYRVKIIDTNTEGIFKGIHDRYFGQLKRSIPETKWGNFFNIGKEVLRNHMMAHLHHRDENEYVDLIKSFFKLNFFCETDESGILKLNRIMDEFYGLLKDYTINMLKTIKPSVFGLSVYQGTVGASMFTFSLAKEFDPRIKTVMGGGVFADHLVPGSPNFDAFLRKTPYIDKLIVGEGESLFLKYLKGELPESQRVYTLKDIDSKVLEISQTAIPDFSDLDLRFYPQPAVFSSRGCPFRCHFCSETVRWGFYRKKAAQQVTADMNELYRRHGSQLFLMCDSLLNPTASQLAEAVLANKIPFYWDGYLRVDSQSSDAAVVLQWRRGGFYRSRLGVESGSARVLELMGKKITPDQISRTVVNLAEAGIKTTTYWVIGYPGETEEDFQQTLNLVSELADDIYEADCNPFTYFFSGQVNSDNWARHRYPLYTKDSEHGMLLQKWDLELEPSRAERYSRLRRFYEHCRKMGIPDPYNLYDINQADRRWQKLHSNAVPPIMSFKKDQALIDECRQIRLHSQASFSPQEIHFNIS